MSTIGDMVRQVVSDVLQDMLKKTTGTGKRARRRRKTRTATPSERLRQIEKLLRPAKARAAPARKQTSRKRTVRTRSKARRRAT